MTDSESDKGENLADIWEKLFGQSPEHGYEFKSMDITLAWRAIIIQWTCSGVGFGELTFIFDSERGLRIDDEMMGEEFVLAAINEATKRMAEGQKAYISKGLSEKGPQYTESIDGNEKLIESILLTFKYYLRNNPGAINNVSSDSNDSEPE